MYNDHELMEIQAEVLFELDHLNRIIKINEPTDSAVPLFFLGRTKEGSVIRFHKNYPPSNQSEILKLIQKDNVELGKIINQVGKVKPVENIWLGPAYVFSEEFRPVGDAIKITNLNKEFLQPGFTNLYKEFEWRQPVYATIIDGMAVSVCCSARISMKAAEASVETLSAYQGSGFAANCVSVWADEVKRSGLIPLFSTSWDNFSSQAIAKKLNLYKYGMDFHIS